MPQKHLMLQNFLQQRQEVLIALTNLATSITFDQVTIKPRIPVLSELLIEYIAIGQFSLFERLLDNTIAQSDEKFRLYNAQLIHRLSKLAVIVVDFCDKYADDHELKLLKQDLSMLSVALHQRLELEDTLIVLCNGVQSLKINSQHAQQLRNVNRG